MLNAIIQQITDLTGISANTLMKMVVMILSLMAIWIVRHIVIRVVWHRTDDVRARYIWQKTTTYIALFFAFICISIIWVPNPQSLTTFLGLFSAGLAIALHDIIANLAGWIYILAKRPFALGDRVQSGAHAGDVVDISVFHFALMEIGNWVEADQSTGRVIHVPNSAVFKHALANYSKGFEYIWNEIPVLITFESDWKKAKELLQEIADTHARVLTKTAEKKVKEASRRFMIFYSTLTPTVYTSVRDSGVLLTIRHLCEPRQRRSNAEMIYESILAAFAEEPDINFAYPTQRITGDWKRLISDA